MKKRIVLITAAALCLCLMFTAAKKELKELPITGKKVLVAVKMDGANFLPEDQIIIDHLKALGLEVTANDASKIKPEDDANYDLIFIAESVSSGKVGNKFLNSKKPFMSCEHYIADDMGFAGTETNKDFGQTEVAYTEINIVDGTHLAAAKLSGKVAVYKETGKYSFSKPAGQVNIIATMPDDESKAVIYAYEKNKKNKAGAKVPARRLFFYLFQGQEGNQTEAGWKLFDAGIKWSLNAYSKK